MSCKSEHMAEQLTIFTFSDSLPSIFTPFSVSIRSSAAPICVYLEPNRAVCGTTANEQSLAALECAADVNELIWSPKTEYLLLVREGFLTMLHSILLYILYWYHCCANYVTFRVVAR